jgi:hypothetical protein
MSKLFLKIIAISLLTSPFNTQIGWCMDEIIEPLNSVTQKAITIKASNKPIHTFEQDTSVVFSGVNNYQCKNCREKRVNCHGFGGGVEEEIKRKANEINFLLEKIKNTYSSSEKLVYDLKQ